MTLVGVAVRGALGNKFRTVMTIVAIAISMFTFLLIQSTLSTWKRGGEHSVKNRIVGYGKTTELPVSYIDFIRNTAHVRSATYSVYFGGVDPTRSSEFFGSAAVDSESYLQVFPDISVPADQIKAWQEDRQGALIGDVLARSMGWKLGDRITLESASYPSPEGAPWTLTVRAIYKTNSKSLPRKSLFFHWKYLNENLPVELQNIHLVHGLHRQHGNARAFFRDRRHFMTRNSRPRAWTKAVPCRS